MSDELPDPWTVDELVGTLYRLSNMRQLLIEKLELLQVGLMARG